MQLKQTKIKTTMINFAKAIEVRQDRFPMEGPMWKVVAYSFTDDNTKSEYCATYHKDATIKVNGPDRIILSFGWPCEYNIFDLHLADKQVWDDTINPDFCIDAGGRNHNSDGKAVYVPTKVVWQLCQIAKGMLDIEQGKF
jgi:hypothetical protein